MTRQNANEEIRYFTKLCNTSHSSGTTIPSGVSCLDAYYKSNGYTPHVRVSGNDARWRRYDLFPQGTEADERLVMPQDMREALKEGDSVIMLLGFYEKKPGQTSWRRVSGHFVAVTGFWHRYEWGNDEILLQAINPAVDYTQHQANEAFDRIRMHRASSDTPGELVRYELSSSVFAATGYRTFLESIVRFSATKD